MDLDLIRKLIRLANNNPNDNEANLAARKACKMIADGKVFEHFAKIATPPASGTRQGFTQHGDVDPYDIMTELMERLRRDKERSKQTQQAQERKYKEQKERERYTQGTWEPPDYENPMWKGSDGVNKRMLRCSKCGQAKPTRFRGAPDIWICMECRGKEFKDSF